MCYNRDNPEKKGINALLKEAVSLQEEAKKLEMQFGFGTEKLSQNRLQAEEDVSDARVCLDLWRMKLKLQQSRYLDLRDRMLNCFSGLEAFSLQTDKKSAQQAALTRQILLQLIAHIEGKIEERGELGMELDEGTRSARSLQKANQAEAVSRFRKTLEAAAGKEEHYEKD